MNGKYSSSHVMNPNRATPTPSLVQTSVYGEEKEFGDKKEPKIEIKWSFDNENMLAEWCDIAQCYGWLNAESHAYYSNLHAWFTIPTITFSTISGTASFAQASLPDAYVVYAPMVIGTINIVIGILTTVQQYLKVSELKESHRLSAVAWDRYARNIRIELTKYPLERKEAGLFVKLCRHDFDKLMEANQTIPKHIIRKFKRKFAQDKRGAGVFKPNICDTIVSINDTRYPWFTHREKFNQREYYRDHKSYQYNRNVGENPPPGEFDVEDERSSDEHDSDERRRSTRTRTTMSVANLIKHDRGDLDADADGTWIRRASKYLGDFGKGSRSRANSVESPSVTSSIGFRKDQYKNHSMPYLPYPSSGNQRESVSFDPLTPPSHIFGVPDVQERPGVLRTSNKITEGDHIDIPIRIPNATAKSVIYQLFPPLDPEESVSDPIPPPPPETIQYILESETPVQESRSLVSFFDAPSSDGITYDMSGQQHTYQTGFTSSLTSFIQGSSHVALTTSEEPSALPPRSSASENAPPST